MQKLTSVKFWVTVWAGVIITFIVVTGKNEFLPLAMTLSAVPLGYLGANVYQKKLFAEREKEEECVGED